MGPPGTLGPRDRLRQWLGLRIGMLHMYAPRPLRLPAAATPGRGDGLPSISLVTPVFNQAAFIGDTLASARDQGSPRLEHIVVDGGSRDGTREIVERFAPSLAHWESGPDAGQADALNKGFARSTGEVLGWLNGDDLLLPGALHCIGRVFADRPEVDVVYGDRIVIDAQGREVGRWALPSHSGRVLSWFDFVPQETLFWRRSAWERVGGRLDPAFHFAMDWDLLVRLRDAGARFLHVPRFLGAFRVHAAQKTSAEMHSRGAEEMSRIRMRCLGHDPGRARLAVAVLPYLLRHAAADWRSRLRRGAPPCG